MCSFSISLRNTIKVSRLLLIATILLFLGLIKLFSRELEVRGYFHLHLLKLVYENND